MFFHKNKQNNIKIALALTTFSDCEGISFCANPNNAHEKSQVLSILGVLDESNNIQKNYSFWIDNKTVRNVKPCTLYKIFYKNFEPNDIRQQYPSSFSLVKIKELKKVDNDTRILFDKFMKQERKLIDNARMQTIERIMRSDEAAEEARQKQLERTFKYQNTEFEVEIYEGSDFEFDDEADEFVDEMKIIKEFAKQKDKIIQIALEGAVKYELETAKDWNNNPNLTKEAFIDNLLAHPFHVYINSKNSFQIEFKTNGMFTDHDLVCDIENGKCTFAVIEG